MADQNLPAVDAYLAALAAAEAAQGGQQGASNLMPGVQYQPWLLDPFSAPTQQGDLYMHDQGRPGLRASVAPGSGGRGGQGFGARYMDMMSGLSDQYQGIGPYLLGYLTDPIRDAGSHAYQQAVQDPRGDLAAIMAMPSHMDQYLRDNWANYLRLRGPEGGLMPNEMRPDQPGFGELYAQHRLPEGVTPEMYNQDLAALQAMVPYLERYGAHGPEPVPPATGWATPDEFAQMYGFEPGQDVEDLYNQAVAQNAAIGAGGLATDAAFWFGDITSAAARGAGLAEGAARAFNSLSNDQVLGLSNELRRYAAAAPQGASGGLTSTNAAQSTVAAGGGLYAPSTAAVADQVTLPGGVVASELRPIYHVTRSDAPAFERFSFDRIDAGGGGARWHGNAVWFAEDPAVAAVASTHAGGGAAERMAGAMHRLEGLPPDEYAELASQGVRGFDTGSAQVRPSYTTVSKLFDMEAMPPDDVLDALAPMVRQAYGFMDDDAARQWLVGALSDPSVRQAPWSPQAGAPPGWGQDWSRTTFHEDDSWYLWVRNNLFGADAERYNNFLKGLGYEGLTGISTETTYASALTSGVRPSRIYALWEPDTILNYDDVGAALERGISAGLVDPDGPDAQRWRQVIEQQQAGGQPSFQYMDRDSPEWAALMDPIENSWVGRSVLGDSLKVDIEDAERAWSAVLAQGLDIDDIPGGLPEVREAKQTIQEIVDRLEMTPSAPGSPEAADALMRMSSMLDTPPSVRAVNVIGEVRPVGTTKYDEWLGAWGGPRGIDRFLSITNAPDHVRAMVKDDVVTVMRDWRDAQTADDLRGMFAEVEDLHRRVVDARNDASAINYDLADGRLVDPGDFPDWGAINTADAESYALLEGALTDLEVLLEDRGRLLAQEIQAKEFAANATQTVAGYGLDEQDLFFLSTMFGDDRINNLKGLAEHALDTVPLRGASPEAARAADDAIYALGREVDSLKALVTSGSYPNTHAPEVQRVLSSLMNSVYQATPSGSAAIPPMP